MLSVRCMRAGKDVRELEGLTRYLSNYPDSEAICALGAERRTWVYWLHGENVGVTVKTVGRANDSVLVVHNTVVNLYGDRRGIAKIEEGLIRRLTHPAPPRQI